MSKPIRIKIDGVHGMSGTVVQPVDNDVLVDLSIKMVLSKELFNKYRTKDLDIDDLQELIKNRS